MTMTEQQIRLVIAAQNGDTKSFEQLYSAYYEKVYGFARMILRNERDAEDVLQETFITAWRKLGTLESPPAFSVWIQIIAKNLCNTQLRRKNIAILLDAEQDIENFDIEESEELLPAIYTEREDLKDRLGRIIDGLSDVQRQAVILYYFNELSIDEISEIMECSPGTVKSRLYLARNAIRAEIEEQERKSGEKFYGVSGIPMITFAKLIQSHMESRLISQGVADVLLSAITDSISSGVGAAAQAGAETGVEVAQAQAAQAAAAQAAAAQAAATQAASTQAMNMQAMGTQVMNTQAMGMQTAGTLMKGAQTMGAVSKKSSLAMKIIASIAALAAVGAVIVLVVILVGGNNNGNNNVANSGNDNNITTPSGNGGTATTTADDDDSTQNGGSNGNGGSSGGDVVYNYNDLSTAIADIPRKEALDEMYILLTGYWVTEGNPFVGFTKEGDSHMVEYGLFETEFGARGSIVDGYATGTYEAVLIVHFPAIPANEVNDGRPESTETIYIDISGLYQPGTTIRVKTDMLDDGEWHTYSYGGFTLEAAYNNR